jgi:hypothetical protein
MSALISPPTLNSLQQSGLLASSPQAMSVVGRTTAAIIAAPFKRFEIIRSSPSFTIDVLASGRSL